MQNPHPFDLKCPLTTAQIALWTPQHAPQNAQVIASLLPLNISISDTTLGQQRPENLEIKPHDGSRFKWKVLTL